MGALLFVYQLFYQFYQLSFAGYRWMDVGRASE